MSTEQKLDLFLAFLTVQTAVYLGLTIAQIIGLW